jgi:uncharacterized protein HemY
MNNSILAVETLLEAGDLVRALDAFAMLRPGVKFSSEGLNLSVRIHFAARRWEQVDVLCRVLRKEYPTDVSGFTQGAESLYQQGRNNEAIDLLREWKTATRDEDVLARIERYQTPASSAPDGQR